MTAPIGIQLYSVRDALKEDFEGTLRRLADMGYIGVETANNYGESPESMARLLKSLGMRVCGMHCPLPVGDNKNKVLEIAAALGNKDVICAWMPPERFATRDGIKTLCDELNAANENARAQGLRFSYHNHDFEFTPMADGALPHEVMRQYLAPTVSFEVDTYWVQAAGGDPAAVVRQLGARAPLLHIKDGPAKRGVPMTALGEGVINITQVINAGGAFTEWEIVELDQCATDIFEAIRTSYKYLIGKGLAHGAK
ncbi:MAG TPA: sugar phosphate isomerase/epimerase [Aggregatilineales bacterium]|nr:sugar phosphate isomerase/epimerase [Aggregatilineales bacterium]